MRVITWNIRTNTNLPTLSKLSTDVDVFCLQEVHGNIIISWGLTPRSNYYVGQHKIGRDRWSIIYWNNNYTDNNTMGMAIVYKQTKTLKVIDQGAYTFNLNVGPKSEIRGLPWIRVVEQGNAEVILYSFHSSSSGDNTNHLNQVLNLMSTMMLQTNTATFGDFNLTKNYMAASIAPPLYQIAGDVPTRPTSGKIIDYCVCKNSIHVTYINTLNAQGSDHCPVVYDVYRN